MIAHLGTLFRLWRQRATERGLAAHVAEDLGEELDMILDGGPTNHGVESTVLDLTSEVPTVLRPGAITLEQ